MGKVVLYRCCIAERLIFETTVGDFLMLQVHAPDSFFC